MKRAGLVLLLSVALALPAPWIGGRSGAALAQEADPSAKEAFEAAKELGTVEAWQAFLASYRSGFYADLARAYLKKLGAAETTPPGRPAAPPPAAAAQPPAPAVAPAAPAAPPAAQAPAAAPPRPAAATIPPPPPSTAIAPAVAPISAEADVPPTDPTKPAIARGGRFMGFAERFNRYYTDPAWRPSRIVFVSPEGGGDGTGQERPTTPQAAMAAARPGTFVHFAAGAYGGCFELTKERSGTYDEPIVLYGQRLADGSLGVKISCCGERRQACFNLEAADDVAVDGFELIGGRYGVRTVGAGYPASQHARGIAVLNCEGRDQSHDPFFSGQVDWAVWERIRAHGAGQGDGHGIYLSNGGDWNVVRFVETFNNPHSDFQINADPDSTCRDVGIPFADARCDAYAGEGEGGQGASDYFLIDGNYFHHNPGPGVNFTSLRRSLIRNNVFGFNTRHNVSFWQETDNPKLGSRENRILHNLFVSTGRHGVQFINHSTRNEFVNNVLVGIQGNGASNPAAVLMKVDDTVGENVYRGNLYSGGQIEGRSPGPEEARAEFSPAWFARFPVAPNRDPNDLRPAPGAPFLARGALLPGAPRDRNGTARAGRVDLGPISAISPAAAPAR